MSNDLTQDMLFTISSDIQLPQEPCSGCDKSVSGGPCDDAYACQPYHAWLEDRRTQVRRIAKASDRNSASICHTCPVSGACPVSFEEALSFCPVKCRSTHYLTQRRFHHL